MALRAVGATIGLLERIPSAFVTPAFFDSPYASLKLNIIIFIAKILP
jgi:hypothetical protein